MRSFIPNISEKTNIFKSGISSWGGFHKLFLFSFLFSFVLMLSFIQITLIRNALIRSIKTELLQTTQYLNEFQIDIAYDNIKFNNIFVHPLIEIDNLQIYNLKGKELWRINIGKIIGRPGIFNGHKLNLQLSDMLSFTYGKDTHLISSNAGLKVLTDNQGKFDTLHLRLRNTDIKDFAKAKEIRFDLRNLHTVPHHSLLSPSLESHLEIRDVKLNGLLKYPLTSEIHRIYGKFNLIGSILPQDSLYAGVENWLKNGGFIDIPKLIINWEPLVLVGQGSINFNEKLRPRINITTSSKAMLDLLDDLQKNHFLDRKGVFVANILLNSKAFKLNENDKYLTITTPISYQDNKLSIENITVKKFNN